MRFGVTAAGVSCRTTGLWLSSRHNLRVDKELIAMWFERVAPERPCTLRRARLARAHHECGGYFYHPEELEGRLTSVYQRVRPLRRQQHLEGSS